MRSTATGFLAAFAFFSPVAAFGADDLCHPEGVGFFLKSDDSVPAGCVYVGGQKPSVCAGSWPVRSSSACDVCVNPATGAAGLSSVDLVDDGSWGLFTAIWKFTRPPADLECLAGLAPPYAFPPELRSPCADLFPSLEVVANTCFSFDEDQGFDQVKECFGGTAGTIVNATPTMPLELPRVVGRVGRGLSFKGDVYVEVPNGSAITDVDTENFSIEGWIRPGLGSGVRSLLDKRVGPQTAPFSTTAEFVGYSLFLDDKDILAIQLADGQLQGSGFSAKTYTSYSTKASLFAYRGQWTHFAVTVERNDPAGIKGYVNGVLVGWTAETGRTGSLVNSAPLRLGASYFNQSPGTRFEGSLDEITIYYGALTGPQVFAIYDAGPTGKCPL